MNDLNDVIKCVDKLTVAGRFLENAAEERKQSPEKYFSEALAKVSEGFEELRTLKLNKADSRNIKLLHRAYDKVIKGCKHGANRRYLMAQAAMVEASAFADLYVKKVSRK